MGGIDISADGIGARLAHAEPDGGSVGAEAMLGRVLEGVLEEPAEPLRAGRYVILDSVGRGGLGEVYAAYDPELDRKVAIKLVRAGVSNWGDLDKRMLREAQALAKVQSANVVAIHDVGRFRSQVFIAMELVDGVTLSAWSRAQRRTWTEVRDAFVQAGKGLAAVHAAGLVQRDFKPANVLVGNDGVVKVLDFGLARAIADGSLELPSDHATAGLLNEELTAAGSIAGTPAYMAPEQWTSGSVDAATDQFAFCVALYEALHGERPFPGTDLELRLRAIQAGKLPEPAEARPVPLWLRRVVERGLSASPGDRHASMNDLLVALQHDRRRRSRTWLAVGVAAVLSAAATSIVFATHEPTVSSADLAEIEQLVAEARDAAASHYFVYPPLDDPKHPTAYSRTLALDHIEGPASERAHREAQTLRREFSQALTQLGDAYAAQEGGAPFAAEFYTAAVLFDADNEHARRQSLMTTAQLASLRQRIEREEYEAAELLAGASLAALAEPDEGVRRKKVARLQARRVGAPASTMASLDALLGIQAEPKQESAADVQASAASQAPDATPARPPAEPGPIDTGPSSRTDRKTATKLAKEGLAALRTRELDRAVTLLNRAIAKDRKNAAALGGLATVYFELGRYADAVTYAQRAVKAAPKRARYHLTLGDAYFKVLRYDAAKDAYLEARRLGSPGAQRGLDRVAAKLGAP